MLLSNQKGCIPFEIAIAGGLILIVLIVLSISLTTTKKVLDAHVKSR
jgi:hypothetical protein